MTEIKLIHKSDIISSYKPLFNYHTLIKTLDTFRMELHVINWLNTTTSNVQVTSNEKAYNQLITLQDESNKEIKLVKANKWNNEIQIICTILFNLFVENNVILNKLLFSYDILSHSYLDSLKNSSNTLTSLNFGSDITFDLSYDALSHLTQLKSLQFKDCDLDSNILHH
ncbi:hypothetical protein RhiirA4_480788 [Rhizophagus irregularis]|uniref:Uncharacterized protein n=1 Tax=Rhizophagus irregularis TaxID=588596 RepID=A0A2I1HIF2_9GLOM|nr:hypothetical protein RhiirA4_480788 [Rhizophagus irregularis]